MAESVNRLAPTTRNPERFCSTRANDSLRSRFSVKRNTPVSDAVNESLLCPIQIFQASDNIVAEYTPQQHPVNTGVILSRLYVKCQTIVAIVIFKALTLY